VWQAAHAAAFNVIQSPGRLLVTTRNSEVLLGVGAEEHKLELLSDGASLALLAQWAGCAVEGLPEIAAEVVKECGNLPLALAMIGAMVQQRPTAWADALEELQAVEFESLESIFPEYPYPDLLRALAVSVEGLDEPTRERYLELAVFPEDAAIPIQAIEVLWGGAGLKGVKARRLVDRLQARSLLTRDEEDRIRLHDLQGDYLRKEVGDLAPLHRKLVDAYRARCPEGLAKGADDGYFFQRLPWHLVEGGQKDALRELLLDFHWIERKLAATHINAVMEDFLPFEEERELRLLRDALRLSAHVLVKDPGQLAFQILERLRQRDAGNLAACLAEARNRRAKTLHLQALHASLEQAGGPLLRVLEGHSLGVNSVAVLDTSRVVSASSDKTLRVWDVETGETLQTLEGHSAEVNSVSILDASRVVSASDDKTLRVWDVETGETLQKLEGHSGCVRSVAVLDGSRVVSASDDQTLRVWDVETGATLQRLDGHSDRVRSVAVLDSSRVVSASYDQTVRVWDVETGATLQKLEGHPTGVLSVAVLDSSRVVSASRDRTLRVWSLPRGEMLKTPERRSFGVLSVAVLDASRVVSLYENQTVRLWDVETGGTLQKLKGHSDWIFSLATLDSSRVVPVSLGKTLLVWDLETGETLQTLEGHSDWVRSVAVLDGSRVVSASDDQTLRVWDVETGETLQTLEGHSDWVRSVAVLDASRVISASGDKTLRVWDVETGETLQTLEGHSDWVRFVAVLNASRVVSASHDHTLRVWDVETGETVQTLQGHAAWLTSVAVLDSSRVVFASDDQTLRVWNVETGEQVAVAYLDSPVESVAVVPGPRPVVVAGDARGRVHFLEVQGLT
jgi:WD40 repeat protein